MGTQTSLPLGGSHPDFWIEVSPVLDGHLRVRNTVIDRCLNEGMELLLLNSANLDECMRLDMFTMKQEVKKTTAQTYQNEWEGTYILFQYAFTKKEKTLDYISKWEKNLLVRFQPSWFNMLRKQLVTQEFKDLVKHVRALRDTKTVFPTPEQQFRVFQDTNLFKTKAIIVGQDPYPSNGNANGIPFAVDRGLPMPASLKKINEVLKAEIGKEITDTMFTNVIKQGLLFLNTAWTVEEKAPGSHTTIWEPFTEEVMKVVGQFPYQRLVILMGKQAQSYEKMFTKRGHIIVKCEHPSKAAYEKRKWNDNDAMVMLDGYFKNEHNITLQW